MRITLSGKNHDSSNFTYRDIGFGEDVDLPISKWQADFDLAGFLKVMTPNYDECIDELKRDDELTGEFHPPYKGANEYPDLESFITNNFKEFIEFFRVYLIEEFLVSYFNSSENWKYVINSIDDISLIDGLLIFRGSAYNRQV